MSKQSEGTPKLEEAIEKILLVAERNISTEDEFDQHCNVNLMKEELRGILRPFITPACSPLVECKGRKTCGDNNPGDCDWPFCDCDPRVNKVMQAIWESGYSIVKVTPASTEETRIDVDTLSSWLAVKMPDSLNLNTSERTPVKTWLAERITEFLSTGEANGQQLKDIRAALDDALNYLRTEQYENVGVFIKQAMFYAAPTSVPQARGCSCEPGNHANATACHNLGAKACVGVPQAEPPKCVKGHTLDLENTGYAKDGSDYCIACAAQAEPKGSEN